jgi:hypothetical protein
MDRQRNAAVLTCLVSGVRSEGSWCGETHIQKATYLLEQLFDVELDFEFVLYKHGPFSFDLRDELTALRADEYLRLEAMPLPYGPRIDVGARAAFIQGRFPKTVAKHKRYIDFVASIVGGRGVEELEGLATALYVTDQFGRKNARVKPRATILHEIKPHIDVKKAKAFVEEIDDVVTRSREVH